MECLLQNITVEKFDSSTAANDTKDNKDLVFF